MFYTIFILSSYVILGFCYELHKRLIEDNIHYANIWNRNKFAIISTIVIFIIIIFFLCDNYFNKSTKQDKELIKGKEKNINNSIPLKLNTREIQINNYMDSLKKSDKEKYDLIRNYILTEDPYDNDFIPNDDNDFEPTYIR
ncbi:hypothetical protein HZP59_08825 [Elizabethkingia anophelis]|nr:hypothetical protein [Elizabethkingia anophelis]